MLLNKSTSLIGALGALGLVAGMTATARAQTAGQVVAKARAYLGDDAALSAVKSVHFTGILETDQITPEGRKPVKVAVEIIFQKPYQQRITATSPTSIEITALDDYDGWQRVQDVTNESRWQFKLLDTDFTKRLRANTWENLNFFKGIEQRGGQVEVIGPATVDNSPAIKIAFIHEPGIVFYRSFDPTTGRLMLSETDQGGRIREEGEILVNGLRFPRKVITISKAVDEKGQPYDNTIVITFEKITLNESFPRSFFEVPALNPR
jgi:outer membrane lipoprotein-sorting protein